MIKYKKAFINGKIYTVNSNRDWADTVVTANNKIIFVGRNNEAQKHIDEFTEVIDLNGKLMLPGFTDCHAHVIMGGQFLLNVDLTKVKSKAEFSEKVRDFVKTINNDRWIIGGNWNHQNWEVVELPHKDWIDQFTKDIPVFVYRMDYHVALANSYVLKLAGIDRNTKDPVSGEIVKDENGEPTGILIDKAMDLVLNIIPEPSETEFDEAIDAAMEEAQRLGVTSIHDISYGNHFKALQKAEREGRLTSRLYTRLLLKNYKTMIANEIQYNFGSNKLKIGSLKDFTDGALGSKTAYMSEPYIDDPNNFGLPMEDLQSGKLEEMILESDRNHLQCSIHAIGDRAITELLDIIERMKKENPDWDRRFRIEHAQHISKNDIKRAAELGVIISAQPYHLYDDGCWAESVIGHERIKDFYAFRSILDSGIKLCFGSDWSVSTMDPLKGIYAAVTRATADGKNENGFIPEERISVKEAVDCYTINAAYAGFQEDKVGSIDVGKFADLVILSENIFEIEPAEIKNTKVEMTVFDGEIVFVSR